MQELNQNQIKDIEKGRVLLAFGALWCPHCRAQIPVLEKAEMENPSVSFYKVDIEALPSLATRFFIRSVPTLLYLENGEEMGRRLGFQKQTDMQALLDTAKTEAIPVKSRP